MADKLDALGEKIVIGRKYGFTQSGNGVYSNVIGIAVKETDTRITIEPLRVTHGAYGSLTESEGLGKKRSVYACILFPVNN